MLNYGVSLHVGTILNEPETEAQAIMHREFGGAQEIFAFLRRESAYSIEVRNVRAFMPVERSVAAIRAVHDAGFRATVHIAFEEVAGEQYVNRVRPVIEEALNGQDSVVFIVHPLKTEEDTQNKYADWAQALSDVDPRCRLALENMRTMKPEQQHHRLVSVNQCIQAAPQAPRGICWDMGHYTYNVVKAGLQADACPNDEIMGNMIHTHIHHMYVPDMDTHFPLEAENEPVVKYVSELKKRGYKGIYNIELEPERYIRVTSPRKGMEASVSVLKELMLK